MYRKLISRLSTMCHLSINKLRMVLLMSMVFSVCTINTAGAVTWTAGEIVQAMQQAQANGQPFDKLLAEKVRDEMAKSGLQIIDGNLVFKSVIPATYTSLKDAASGIGKEDAKTLLDYLTALAIVGPGFGFCDVPIPAGSAIAARSSDADVRAQFSNVGTYIDLHTNPNQVLLTLQIDADMLAHSQVGLEWCGFVDWPYTCTLWVKNPLCPPPVCLPSTCYKKVLGVRVPYPCCNWQTPSCSLPDVCAVPIPAPKRVEESWADWAPADVIGKLKGSVTLTLNHSFSITNNTVTVGANATLSGAATSLPYAAIGPVVPDLRLIAFPVPPFLVPHVDTSPALQTLGTYADVLLLFEKVTGNDEIYVKKEVMPGLIKQQQARLDAMFNNYFPIQLQLPTIQDFNNLDPVSQALLKLVLDYLYNNIDMLGEFALDVVKNNWTEVLYYVLTDNRAALGQLFAYQALCPSVERLKANMPATSLYSTAGGTCAAIDPRTPGAGPFYATADCQTEIGFQAENFNGFCRESFTAKPNPLLGNAAAWPSTNVETDVLSTLPNVSSKWSLSSTAQLAVGVEPINNNHIPFVKRIHYRQAGNCALEMRVYKKNISAANLTPLLWIHGGAWTYRSSGFLGMESLVSNYTEDNFVVFAPFYRLVGDKDGSQECRNATWQDMVADVEAALDWVSANGVTFGAGDTTKIPVTGQSAGAHLAGWLMTHRPDQVSRGLLVYPPTDLNDFLIRLQGVGGATFPPLSDSTGTPYDSSSAQEIVETYLQLPLGSARTVDLNNPPLYLSENSFAQKISQGQSAYPPAFILHGTRDSLLTYSQSQVLCESYGGVVNVNWSATPDLRAVYPCGDRSQLHLFKEADHAFEVCPFTNITSACRAGSAESALLLTDSLQKGRQWLSTHNQLQNGVPVTGLSGATAADLIYTFEVPADASNLNFQLNGGSGDADLYVRYGAAPSTAAYDCRPYLDGNAELCSMPNATAGTWYVMVRGYTDFANVSLVATYTLGNPLGNQLQNGVPVNGLSGAFAAEVRYTFEVPAGASNLTFQLNGGSGDADLYVRYGAAPTTTAYDCRPYLDGNAEICTMPNATAGTWYVMIRGYTNFSGVTLMGNYQ